MCTSKSKCEKPANLKGKPQDCSAAQIRKCHGDDKTHPCAPANKTK
jgi:hypothetical protein